MRQLCCTLMARTPLRGSRYRLVFLLCPESRSGRRALRREERQTGVATFLSREESPFGEGRPSSRSKVAAINSTLFLADLGRSVAKLGQDFA